MDYPDLSLYERSVTSRFLVLLTPDYHNLPLISLKEIAIKILNDPKTSVSEHAKRKYILEIEKQKSVYSFQRYITNLTMKGCNLSLNQ